MEKAVFSEKRGNFFRFNKSIMYSYATNNYNNVEAPAACPPSLYRMLWLGCNVYAETIVGAHALEDFILWADIRSVASTKGPEGRTPALSEPVDYRDWQSLPDLMKQMFLLCPANFSLQQIYPFF